jgi:hypothetical protein
MFGSAPEEESCFDKKARKSLDIFGTNHVSEEKHSTQEI